MGCVDHHHLEVVFCRGAGTEEGAGRSWTGCELKPTAVVGEDVGVGKEGLRLGFCEEPVEAFFVVLTAAARLDFDQFGGVGAVIETVAHAVHSAKPARVDLPQIHELLFEALPRHTTYPQLGHFPQIKA